MEYIKKLIELGITQTKTGRQTCPQCSAHRKNKNEKCLSVTFTDDAVLYNCHNCGWCGSVYYREKYEKRKNYTRPAEPKKIDKLDKLYRYFEKRHISKETVSKYKISLNEQNEIIIPYYKNGILANVKYRKNLGDGKKTFRQEKDTEKTLFGMDQVPEEQKQLIWVEGEMDVLALAEQGIYAVSVPCGGNVAIPTTENAKPLDFMENCFDFIERFNEHIIAVDNDKTGDQLKESLLKRLGKEKCKIVNWKQYKDANEALMGGENLQEFLDKADYLYPDGIINYYDCFDDIYKFNYEKDTDFYKSGWDSVDKLIKLRTGRLMVITGYPGRGKSTFSDNLLMNLAKRYDMKHLIASFENTQALHYNRFAEFYRQQPYWKLAEENLLLDSETFSFISEHFYRFDVDKIWNIDAIIERTEMAVKKYGIKTLTIDPYNRLNNDFKDREDRYVGSILSKLCALARRLDILVIFVAHPKKPDSEDAPTMYSISGSGDWYNMCDYGIIVHRSKEGVAEKLSNFPDVYIAKVKDFSIGDPNGGKITLRYDVAKRTLTTEGVIND